MLLGGKWTGCSNNRDRELGQIKGCFVSMPVLFALFIDTCSTDR